MTDTHGRTRAHESTGSTAEETAAAEAYVRGDLAHLSQLPGETVRMMACFIAGRRSAPVVGLGRDGVELLREAGALFRTYEAHHRAKLATFEKEGCCEHCGTTGFGCDHDSDCPNHPEPLVTDQGPPIFFEDMRNKAERNAEIAGRIEDFLAHEPERRDVLCLVDTLGEIHGLSLSLVEDLNEMMEGTPGVSDGDQVVDWEEWFGQQVWSAFARLRDALDTFGNPPLPVDPDAPTLTLIVNGTEYQTTSRRVIGKLGGCCIDAHWDGQTTLRISVGPHEPGEPPVDRLHARDNARYGDVQFGGERQPVPGVYGPDQGRVPDAVEDQRLRRYGPDRLSNDGGQGSREQSFGGSGPPSPPEGPCGHYPVEGVRS